MHTVLGEVGSRANNSWLKTALGLMIILALVAAGVMLNRPKTAKAALDAGRYAQARVLLLASAEAGDPRAQNDLGNLYYLGLGGRTDYDQAFHWYMAAALQKFAGAQVNVARMYQHGLGVPKSPLRGFAWLRQARINGSEVAENHMKWLFSSLSLSPGQLQKVKDLYGELEQLRPTGQTLPAR